MSQEVFVQADEFFKDKKEWYAYLNLCEYTNGIINYWFKKCKQKLNQYFQSTCFDEKNKWLYRSENNFDCKWYLKDFEEKSIILFFQNSQLSLMVDGNFYNIEKIINLLNNEPRFKPIIDAFEEPELVLKPNNWVLIYEKGNFRFNDDKYNGNFDNQRLAWHANFNTDEFAKQIIDKVNRFINDEKITNLLYELNKETKKET